MNLLKFYTETIIYILGNSKILNTFLDYTFHLSKFQISWTISLHFSFAFLFLLNGKIHFEQLLNSWTIFQCEYQCTYTQVRNKWDKLNSSLVNRCPASMKVGLSHLQKKSWFFFEIAILKFMPNSYSWKTCLNWTKLYEIQTGNIYLLFISLSGLHIRKGLQHYFIYLHM